MNQSTTTSADPKATPASVHAMPLATDDVISLLNGLIETCKDGEAGFRQAASEVKHGPHKAMFTRISRQRAEFATELQSEVRKLGGDPEKSGTVVAALHRGWNEVKTSFAGRDDAAILNECESGEDSSKKNYNDAASKTLPADLTAIIVRQAAAVRAAHDEVRDERNRQV